MARATSGTMVSGSSIYAYVEVDGIANHSNTTTMNVRGGVTSPYNWAINCESRGKWWEGGTTHDATGWSDSRYFGGYGDLQLLSTTYTFDRYAYNRTVSVGCESWCSLGSATAWIDNITIPALPPSATTLTATRETDNKVTLSWPDGGGIKNAICIERRVDGGVWGEVQVIWNNPATSWADTSTSANHSYDYRFRYHNVGAYGSYSNTATVTMTPSAPKSISSVAVAGTTVTINVENASPVATMLQYEVSVDDGETWGQTQDSQSLTRFDADVPGIGRVRVRNVFDGVTPPLTSAWLESDAIVTITPPLAPTLGDSPVKFFDIAKTHAIVTWTHNHPDKSAQQAFQFRFKFDDAADWYETITVRGDGGKQSSYSFEVGEYMYAAGIDAPCTIEYQIATKGAHDSYGPFSSSRTFSVLTAPTVALTSPSIIIDGVNTVTSMPIYIEARYDDASGYCAGAEVTMQCDGRTIYPSAGQPREEMAKSSVDGQTILSAYIDTDEFLPTNRGTYTVTVSARSSSTLQSSANTTFFVDFAEPAYGNLEVANDPETGYVSLLATFDNSDADEPAVSISVARINPDGTMTPILTDGQSGAFAEDRYAPLNTRYRYAVTTKAASKAATTVYVENIFETDRWFVYWDGKIACAKWNPEGSFSITRPEKRRVHYAGRKWALSYDSKAQEQTHSMSWNTISGEEWENGFYELMDDGGRGVYKGCDGWVFHADFDYSETPSYTSLTPYSQVSLTITRIDGEKL